VVADDGAGTVTTTQFEAGATFAGYRIEAEIGRGGMGVVYRALDVSLERPIALKLIAPELANDEGFRKRFLRESRLAASLDHPHVLPVFSAGEEDGHLYLAMRYVEGEDLKTRLRREGTLSPEQAIRICSQVAEALDAAHRRGLVHRDLKPANVLLDVSGEAYLADFGLTKPVGSASTETGHLVGTLDYLAPEQIRGEEIDARTDVYALACVLYECLAGQAPFHRSTEAELLWAHMQEDPPSLTSRPELDPVFRQALAKEKEGRYESAAAFVEAVAAAIGLETPRLRRRRRLVRRSRLLLAAGVLLLAGAATAVGVAITRPSEPKAFGNAVAAIEAANGGVSSYTATGTTPSNVVIGGGSVWVLNADDRTISRIDPTTRRIVKTFATGGRPTDLAFGDGSLWVGNGSVAANGLASQVFTSSVARIDPETYKLIATVPLPYDRKETEAYTSPISRLAAYRGSVWAISPDLSAVLRIDAETNTVEKRIPVTFANAIAAGREGVWVARNVSDVTRIDPRTDRIGQTISVPAGGFAGIAVGDGSVWATSPDDGTVWRIEPGPHPTTRTISVGSGITFVAFADGAVWTANFIQDTVSHIDPRTNTVVSRTPIAGTPLGVAADHDLVWTSTAGALQNGALPGDACGNVESGGKTPDLLVASDLPLQEGGKQQVTRSMADAISFVLRRHGYRAGEYVVGYQSCDDSTVQSGGADYFKCASNAKAYSAAPQLVGLIGPYNSYCAEVQLPILNRASSGSVPVISSSNTDPALTRAGPGVPRGYPESFYPTGVRNYVRVVPGDDLAAAASAVFAKQLGLRKVYVVRDDYVGWSSGFTRAARRIGLPIAGSAAWAAPGGNAKQRKRQAKLNAALARRVARSGADGVFLGGVGGNGGNTFLRALRARVGGEFPIILTDGFFPVPQVMRDAGRAALNTYVIFPGLGTLSSRGRRLWRSFVASQPGGTVPNGTYVPQTLQAAELMLAAIARSDGTRGSVLRELRRLRVPDGVLGPSRFDANGDVTPEHVTVFRITGRTPRSANLVSDFRGSVPVRVVSIPSSLLD
jgi:DNA-binding beta-propeller fold protein YncE/ABC-type branched-subunit amino acid transport system substrate-binding protein